MAAPQEQLFIEIASEFKGQGFLNAAQSFDMVAGKLKQLSEFIFQNTIGAWASLEAEMINVSKTAELTGPEMEAMAIELMKMSNATGQGAEELAKIAAAAGQLGVKKEDILSFTKEVNQMAIAFDMSADEAATAGAKIANSFKLDVTELTIRRLGDTINSLASKFAVTEKDLVNFTQRAGSMAATLGVSIEQVSALGTAVIQAGMGAEEGATSIGRALTELTNPKKIEGFAKLLSISTEQFKSMLEKDVYATLVTVVKQIEKMPSGIDRANTSFELFGEFGKKSIMKIVGSSQVLDSALKIATEKLSPMAEEFKRVMDGIGKQMDRTWTILKNIGKLMGIDMEDPFMGVLETLNYFLEGIFNLMTEFPKLRGWFSSLVAVVGGFGAALGVVTGMKGIGALLSGLAALGGAGAAAAGAGGVAATGGALGVAATGFGALATAMGTVALAGASVFAGWGIGSFIGELKSVQGIMDSIFEALGFFNYEVAELGEKAKGRPGAPQPPKGGGETGGGAGIEVSFKRTGDDFIDYILDNLVVRAQSRSTCACSTCG